MKRCYWKYMVLTAVGSLVLSLLIGSGVWTYVRAANLVQNPGFESNFSGWTDWGNTSITTNISHVHSGSKAARVGKGAGGRYQLLSVSPNTTYILSGWGKVGSSSESGATIGLKNESGWSCFLSFTETTYTYKERTCVTPSDLTGFKVYFWKDAGSSYFYVDDISVDGAGGSTPTPVATFTSTAIKTFTPTPTTPTSTPTRTPTPEGGSNVVQNPGFESDFSGWTDWGNTSITSDARSGSKAARVGTGDGGRYQLLSVSPNITYVLSGWGKVGSSSEPGATIGLKNESGWSCFLSFSETTYTYKERTCVTPSDLTGFKVYFWKSIGSSYFYVDDISVGVAGGSTPIPTNTPTRTPTPAATPTTAPTSTPTRTPTPAGTPDWVLVWSDEFNSGSVPDPTYWGYEIGFIRNNELQYYTDRPENAYISNGNLVIKAIKENYQGAQYTSASLQTKYKYSFQYGRLEARMKLPMGKGLWPAFWTMGENYDIVNWPACGEIDVMEHVNTETQVHGTVHWDDGGHQSNGASTPVADPSAYHLYSIEWDSSSIKWFVDGVQYHAVNISPGSMSEFRAPHFIMFSLAVGGDWPGPPDGSTVFPAYLYIDYVRVYQRAGSPTLTPTPSVTPAPPGTNLVQNPGFESDLAYWESWGGTTVITSDAHSGTKAAKVGTDEGGRGQAITLEPNTVYKLSGWGKVSSAGKEAWIGVKNTAGGWEYSLTFNTTTYTYREVTFTTSSSTRGVSNVYLWKGAGSFYLFADDISLVKQ